MRLCRIRVVRVRDGGPVSIPAAAVRWAVLIIPGLAIDTLLRMRSDLIGDAFVLYFALALAWPIILLASMFRSPTRQGLHDRAAGTAVIAWW